MLPSANDVAPMAQTKKDFEVNMSNENIENMSKKREKAIVRTSVAGIITNVFLAGFKAAVGIIANSIAVTLDAVNNLSDALSSVVTIIGAKLGAKQPNKKHPLGYGRIEYLSSMIVAAIVLYAGITSAVESVKKIISPETADYGTVSLIIISVAIAVKLVLGQYVKRQGKKYNSGALVASGSDALFDAILSASVLASAIVYLIWNISLEAYVGVLIAGFIIKAGIEMMIETVDDILGKRGDKEETDKIKSIICEEPEVRGAYDLILFNYGPDKNYGSVHVELPDGMGVDEVDRLTRRIETKVYKETGVILTGIGVYSFNTANTEAAKMRDAVVETLKKYDWLLQLHGFYADTGKKTLRFDAVISFDVDRAEAMRIMTEEITNLYPDYALQIVPDIDA